MANVQNVFCITGIDTNFSKKTIIIETNFHVDANTVDLDTVRVYSINNEVDIELPQTIKTRGKKIYVYLEDFPAPNESYYLIVRNIKDKLGRVLADAFDKRIYFDFGSMGELKIISPKDQYLHTIKDEPIRIKLAISNEDTETKYRFEISSDIAFFNKETILISNCKAIEMPNNSMYKLGNVSKENIVYATDEKGNVLVDENGTRVIESSEVIVNLFIKKNEIFYLRARLEKTENYFSDWSEMVQFQTCYTAPLEDDSGYLDDNVISNREAFEDFLSYEDMFAEEDEAAPEIVNKSEIGKTNQEFYVEYNKNIKFKETDESQFTEDGLLYIGKTFMTRRDL
jgi:hypothetical protein